MPSVLFVCTGNQYRSPIAAAFFSRLLVERGLIGKWLVGSAGTWTIPQQYLPQDAARDAALVGVDIQDHLTQEVNDSLLEDFDLILAMENGQKEALCVEFPFVEGRILLLSEMVDGVAFDIPDPLRFPGEHFRILHEMCNVIRRGFPKIIELAEGPARRQS